MKLWTAFRIYETTDIDYTVEPLDHDEDPGVRVVRRWIRKNLPIIPDHMIMAKPLPHDLGGQFVYIGDPGGHGRAATMLGLAVWPDDETFGLAVDKMTRGFPGWTLREESITRYRRVDPYGPGHAHVLLNVNALPAGVLKTIRSIRDRVIRDIGSVHESHAIDYTVDYDAGEDPWVRAVRLQYEKDRRGRLDGTEHVIAHGPLPRDLGGVYVVYGRHRAGHGLPNDSAAWAVWPDHETYVMAVNKMQRGTPSWLPYRRETVEVDKYGVGHDATLLPVDSLPRVVFLETDLAIMRDIDARKTARRPRAD